MNVAIKLLNILDNRISDDEYNKKEAEIIMRKLIGDKNIMANGNIVAATMQSIQLAKELVQKLEFIPINEVSDEILFALSPYKTLCTREKFYYDPVELEKYDDLHFAQIIMCEVFNAWSDYYLRTRITEKSIKMIAGNSLIMMHKIKLVPEKVRYAGSTRNEAYELFYKENPQTTVIAYGPNKIAAKYLYNDLKNGNTTLEFIKNGKETIINKLTVTESWGILMN